MGLGVNDGSARSTGGGGAATSAGILFEAQLGAMIGSWILAGRSIDRRLDLGDARVNWVRFETEAPVDDILAATSNGGFIAFQAKTSLSISRDLNSPFGKTIGQFVRQWLACRDGDGTLQWNRPMSTDLDRLVLATAPHAPATVRIDLADALRLSAQPGGGTLTDAQAAAYAAYEVCVASAWAAASTDVFDPAFPARLAGYIRILTVDALGAGREAVRALLQIVIAEGANADAALSALEASSTEMMARRGGADLVMLRQMLLTAGVKLAAPPAFAGDIAALRSHSDDVAAALRRYEIIEGSADKPLSIVRECQAPLHAAALAESLLIVGEPGAGSGRNAVEAPRGTSAVRRVVGMADEWIIATGVSTHYILPEPRIACRFHSWSTCREAGAHVGNGAVDTPAVGTPRAFFTDNNVYHCAHATVIDRRELRCQIAALDARTCCSACALHQICWSEADTANLPCGS